ncbi:MAG: hypothetical protein ABIN83_06410 [Sphingomicrobium sp.]
MRGTYLGSDRGERAKAAGATLAVNFVLGLALIAGLAVHSERRHDTSLLTFDVARRPPPPEEPQAPAPAKRTAGPAAAKARASAIVAPPEKIPVEQPLNAAPVAGSGAASSIGASDRGAGLGGGGSGNGPGSGGNGGGERIGARLLAGTLTRRDYRTIARSDLPSGSAMYVLLVNPAGRVERCRAAASSGSARVDQSLCLMLSQRLIFRPAMEADGRPIYQDVNYVARWGR